MFGENGSVIEWPLDAIWNNSNALRGDPEKEAGAWVRLRRLGFSGFDTTGHGGLSDSANSTPDKVYTSSVLSKISISGIMQSPINHCQVFCNVTWA